MRRRRAHLFQDDGGIDLTSLLDVIFNLVFFFIVATNIRTDERFFELTLPSATEGETVRQPQTFPEVAVAKDGTIALDGDVLEPQALEARLRELIQEDPKRKFVLSADAEATVQQTTVALDILQRARVQNLIQRVRPQK
jgi:biopolymer transport protein ExbD